MGSEAEVRHSDAQGELDQCKDNLDAASAASRDHTVALTAAKEGVQKYFADVKVCADALDTAKQVFQDFAKGAMKEFNELKDRQSPETVMSEISSPAPPDKACNLGLEHVCKSPGGKVVATPMLAGA